MGISFFSDLWKSTFIRNVSSTFFIQVLTLALGLLNGAIIARNLGTDGKGFIQLSLLVPAMLILFLSGGIGVANVYFVGRRVYPLSVLSSLSVTFTLITTLLGTIIVGIVFMTGLAERLLPGVPIGLLLLALTSLPLELLRYFLAALLQGLQKIYLLNVVSLTSITINLLITFLLVVKFSFGATGAILSYVLSSFIGCTLITVAIVRNGGKLWPSWHRAAVIDLLKYGLRGYFGNLLQFYNYRLDNFLVNYYLGASGVGIYSISVRLAELLWRFPDAVGFVIFPKAATTSAEAMNRITPRIFRLTLIITILGGAFLALFGNPLITWVYTDQFASAFTPMLWLLPGVILLGAAKVLTNEIAGRGFPHYNSLNSGLALILTIGFDLLLIPKWGVTGAAAASTIAYSVIFFASIAAYTRISRLTMNQSNESETSVT